MNGCAEGLFGRDGEVRKIELKTEMRNTRILLMKADPFYGSLLLNIPIEERSDIATACTDGRAIYYNPRFLGSLSEKERRFVLMHELFHVLLRHPLRMKGRNAKICNVAADLIVNAEVIRLMNNRGFNGIFPMSVPSGTLRASLPLGIAMEELYARLKADNKENPLNQNILLRKSYISPGTRKNDPIEVPLPRPGERDREMLPLAPDDLESDNLSAADQARIEKMLRGLIKEALRDSHGGTGSLYRPREILALGSGRPLNWKRILKDLLSEEQDEDTSYATPERKYIHMDLILPGHGQTEERLNEAWAFVDSSGSIGDEQMHRFLCELLELLRSFGCTLHLAYWDTEVTDVYRKIRTKKELEDSKPMHSGGTDINCVFQWMDQEKIKPDVLLILTDGYFGVLKPQYHRRSLRDRTILVLSESRNNTDAMRKIGKVAVLEGR